ncbi:MAG: DNA primase [Accumulibacter sp.]|jgi:hypothetical protein|uniref:DNA primase n=1 Tax=Accumulibacter sp. TaxID=2053492 RepID=UPI002FC39DD6
MSNVDNLIARLDRVRRTKPGHWAARCPSHDDRGPSLFVRELDDGRLLVHCFAGCSVEEVLSSVGLTFEALFPEREITLGKPERMPFPAIDILRAISFEALVVAAAGAALLAGKPFSEVDRERLILAVERIQSAITAGGLSHE